MTLSCCHSSPSCLIYCPVWHLNCKFIWEKRLALSYVCISPNTWESQTCFFGVVVAIAQSINNTLIQTAGELHMLMSPDSRDESGSAPGLLAEGKWLDSEFMHDCPTWCCTWMAVVGRKHEFRSQLCYLLQLFNIIGFLPEDKSCVDLHKRAVLSLQANYLLICPMKTFFSIRGNL